MKCKHHEASVPDKNICVFRNVFSFRISVVLQRKPPGKPCLVSVSIIGLRNLALPDGNSFSEGDPVLEVQVPSVPRSGAGVMRHGSCVEKIGEEKLGKSLGKNIKIPCLILIFETETIVLWGVNPMFRSWKGMGLKYHENSQFLRGKVIFQPLQYLPGSVLVEGFV